MKRWRFKAKVGGTFRSMQTSISCESEAEAIEKFRRFFREDLEFEMISCEPVTFSDIEWRKFNHCPDTGIPAAV